MEASLPETSETGENSESQGGPKFSPQLYIQRYGYVRKVLQDNQVKSVVDFGSAQCKVVTLLKTVSSLETISLVDMDRALLEANAHSIKPLLYEFLQRRDTPLTIRVFHGDATRPDARLMDCDAVTMIEFIEHLVSADLEQVVERVFGDIRPRLVVMTTPNADFNVLFPNFSDFRHWDHKFEWTREEFQTWCESICSQYDYTVTFDGVGNAPEESIHLGHCSQAAIFTRTNQSSSVRLLEAHSYTLISETVYPHKQRQMSLDEKIAQEVQYYVRQLASQGNNGVDSDTDGDADGDAAADGDEEVCTVIPIGRLLAFRQIQEICDIHKLRSYLRSCYRLSKNEDQVFVPVEMYNYNDDDDTLELEENGLESGDAQIVGDWNNQVVTCEDSWD